MVPVEKQIQWTYRFLFDFSICDTHRLFFVCNKSQDLQGDLTNQQWFSVVCTLIDNDICHYSESECCCWQEYNNAKPLLICYLSLYRRQIKRFSQCVTIAWHVDVSSVRLFHYKYCTKFTANTLSTQIFLNPIEPLLNNATYFLRTSF